MSDIVKVEENENFDKFEVVCGDCKGEQIQMLVNNENALSKKRMHNRWLLHCTLCGLRSKVYTTKINNGPTEEKVYTEFHPSEPPSAG